MKYYYKVTAIRGALYSSPNPNPILCLLELENQYRVHYLVKMTNSVLPLSLCYPMVDDGFLKFDQVIDAKVKIRKGTIAYTLKRIHDDRFNKLKEEGIKVWQEDDLLIRLDRETLND